MSISELKKQCIELAEDQKLFLMHFLRHCLREQSMVNRKDLDQRHERLEQGERITFRQLKNVHESLSREGL